MRDLSVIIPARNEMWLTKTVEDILAKKCADTEVIVILDGYWPEGFDHLYHHKDVVTVHHTEAIGQRAATNEGARISQARHVMKIDAHCSVDEGFDAKLIEDCRPDWTMVPSMWNLHAFDWECIRCGWRDYQANIPPEQCKKCQCVEFNRALVWKPRKGRLTVSWRFDDNLQFQYWRKHHRRPECKGDLVETMSFIGACMLMTRDRYWELEGLDENHGSWGQFGTEIALKSWLSGGKLITTRRTWFAHMFRTGNFAKGGHSSFPYPLSQEAMERARSYSRDFWFSGRWPKAKHDVSWLVEKFKPVPDWHKGAK